MRSGFSASSPSSLGESSQGAGGVTVPTPSPTPAPPIATPAPSPTATPTATPQPTATPIPAARSSTASNASVCATATTIPGLDVSDYDPGTQWTTVQHAGAGFTFIKATEGTSFTNDLFASDWVSAKSAGLVRGAYHFYHPADDPTAQAQFFLKTIGTLGTNDFGPMLDWEVSDGVSAATQIANAKIWLNLVEAATGKIPVIYVDASYWNELGNPTGFQKYPLFIAHYDVKCPAVPPPWTSWTFWQTGTGPITGVTTAEADIDVFNGTLAQLTGFVLNGNLPSPLK